MTYKQWDQERDDEPVEDEDSVKPADVRYREIGKARIREIRERLKEQR